MKKKQRKNAHLSQLAERKKGKSRFPCNFNIARQLIFTNKNLFSKQKSFATVSWIRFKDMKKRDNYKKTKLKFYKRLSKPSLNFYRCIFKKNEKKNKERMHTCPNLQNAKKGSLVFHATLTLRDN